MNKYKLPATIMLILAGLSWIWISRVDVSQQPSTIQAPQQGFLAPDFELTSLSGETFVLSELRGKIVILNFWASWCPPCRAEMPDFQQSTQEYSSDDLIVLGVNQTHQDSLPEVQSFVDQYQLGFPIPLDLGGQVGQTYLIHSLPTTFIIDKNGLIDEVLIGGPIPLSLLRVKINRLLQESSNAANP